MPSSIWHLITLLLLIFAVVEALVLIGVLRELGSVLARIAPPHPGSVEAGPRPGQRLERLEDLGLVPPAVAVFVAPGCAPCAELTPALPTVRRHYPDLHVVPIVTGSGDDARQSYAAGLGLPARTDLSQLLVEWLIPGTPFAVGIDRNGVVASAGVVNNIEHLEALCEAAELGFEAPPTSSTQEGDEAIAGEPTLVA